MERWSIISYFIYFPAAFYIVAIVGWQLFKHGRIYLITFFDKDIEFADRINNLLLIGFYLVNIGFAFLAILIWPTVHNLSTAIAAALSTIGKLCLVLGILHVNNKACIIIYAFNNQLFNFKK